MGEERVEGRRADEGLRGPSKRGRASGKKDTEVKKIVNGGGSMIWYLRSIP